MVKVIVILAALLGLGGCGGGGSSETTTTTAPANVLTSVSWHYENRAPDLSTNGATCVLVLQATYSETIAQSDIQSITVTAPTGWRWNITAPNIPFRTGSSGQPVISASLYFGQNPQAFPLAGTWSTLLTLKDGRTSTLQGTFREPGSATTATHPYVFTQEDWTPSTNAQQYVAALQRFPASGYTVQYNATNGGKITSTGFASVMAAYLQAEPRAYNVRCWLYDQNKSYLGFTNAEYSSSDHSPSNLLTQGELSIVPASTTSAATSGGPVDLAAVRYIRVVWVDGAQYAPKSYSMYAYLSISSLVPVY